MIFSDDGLIDLLSSGALEITDVDLSTIQPSSIDLRLSPLFRVFDTHKYTHIDPHDRQPDLTKLIDVKDRPFVLHPDEFVLGQTHECVTLDAKLTARIEGKSSNGRLGIQVHSTAGVIDPGFCGNITLELSNVAKLPVLLWPMMWIAQLTVFELSSPARRPYGSLGLNSKYQYQMQPTASLAFLNQPSDNL